MRAGRNGTSLEDDAFSSQPTSDLASSTCVAAAILEAQHVFQQDFQGFRQFGDVAQGLGGLSEREILVVFPVNGQGFLSFRAIMANGCQLRKTFPLPLVIWDGLNHSA